MRPLLRPTIAFALVAFLLISCTSSDDDQDSGPGAFTDPGTAGALDGYWEASGQAGTALATSNDLWETFAAQAADPTTDASDALLSARAFASACTLAAADLQAWADLERSISSYGGVKSEIEEDARDAALLALETAAESAAAGAEALVVSWRTLGGLASLRDALAEPEGQLPVQGLLAGALEQRLETRDAAVVAAIGAGDDRSGWLPLADIPGGTPSAQIASYMEMADDDPVKLACRAAVPAWDTTERAESLALLERAARGRLRWFADVAAGGATIADLPTQLTSALESSPATHELTLDLRDGTTGEPIEGDGTILLHRLAQPSEAPRQAVLAGTAPMVIADVPAGPYAVVAMADGWARAVLPSVTIDGDQLLTLSLTHLTTGAVLFDGISAPATAGAGARLQVEAAAASSLGQPLTFIWTVDGPAVEGLVPAGARCAFTPQEAGTYTIAVTVRDDSGHAVVDETTVDVKPFALDVFRTDFMIEQVVDYHLNPGERDTLRLWVANRGDETVQAQVSIQGRDGIEATAAPETWTLDPGNQTRWTVPVAVPVDYDQDYAYLDFMAVVDGDTLVQVLEERVDFYVTLDYIRSPITSRVLTVSGVVANPALATASMVIDRDRDAVYQLPLNNGSFEQVVILPGSAETRRVRLEIVAEAGFRREEARGGFMAAIAPADFRATLFWDTDGTDVDLWVTDPDGEKCYYANKITATGLDLDVDDVTGYGPENITGESNLPAGDYLVQVHYYSDHGTNLDSHCTVLVTQHEGSDQQTVDTYEQTITDGQVWTVCTVSWNGSEVTKVTPGGRIETRRLEAMPAK
jgi:hypothetical protein